MAAPSPPRPAPPQPRRWRPRAWYVEPERLGPPPREVSVEPTRLGLTVSDYIQASLFALVCGLVTLAAVASPPTGRLWAVPGGILCVFVGFILTILAPPILQWRRIRQRRRRSAHAARTFTVAVAEVEEVEEDAEVEEVAEVEGVVRGGPCHVTLVLRTSPTGYRRAGSAIRRRIFRDRSEPPLDVGDPVTVLHPPERPEELSPLRQLSDVTFVDPSAREPGDGG